MVTRKRAKTGVENTAFHKGSDLKRNADGTQNGQKGERGHKKRAARAFAPPFTWKNEDIPFLFAGRRVLTLSLCRAQGDTPAAAHINALGDALCGYAERELLPPARTALEQSFAAGQGHLFSPHVCRLSLTAHPYRHGVYLRLTLSFVGEGEFSRTLHTFWSRDGAFQQKRPLFWRLALKKV